MPNIPLCPGQGAQHVGMAKAWCDRSAAARQTFERAEEALGLPLRRLCFEGPEAELNRTDIAQAAIYTASVACFAGLVELEVLTAEPAEAAVTTRTARPATAALKQPTTDNESRTSDCSPAHLLTCSPPHASCLAATAGLSLGEFTALHLAGAMDFETGLMLVRLRGEAMQAAAESTPSGMVALIGCDEAQAGVLCAQAVAAAGDGHVLVPANFNCPGQVVVSGTLKACERSTDVAAAMGLRASRLSVVGAFHSPVMAPAAERLAEALEGSDLGAPAVPVVSNVTARPHDADPKSIKQRLLDQLTSPVRWSQSIEWLLENVQGQLVELAPGRVLAGLMRRIDRKAVVHNQAEPSG